MTQSTNDGNTSGEAFREALAGIRTATIDPGDNERDVGRTIEA
jgi:hypothetical protein